MGSSNLVPPLNKASKSILKRNCGTYLNDQFPNKSTSVHQNGEVSDVQDSARESERIQVSENTLQIQLGELERDSAAQGQRLASNRKNQDLEIQVQSLKTWRDAPQEQIKQLVEASSSYITHIDVLKATITDLKVQSRPHKRIRTAD
jgi:hypothetical protein